MNTKIADAYFGKTNQPRRIASLDFQRGIAIWVMTLMHTFEHLYDYSWVKEEPEKILELPLTVLIFGMTLGFFMSWHAYFLLISSVVNTISMNRKIPHLEKQYRAGSHRARVQILRGSAHLCAYVVAVD